MERFFHRLLRKPANWIGILCAAIVILVALAGNLSARYDPLAVNTANRFKPPQAEYWLGTDNLGRDIASRTLAGTRLALQSCLVILTSATLVGTTIGLVSGFYGGVVDEVLMRISDVFIAFPGLVLALAIAAALVPT